MAEAKIGRPTVFTPDTKDLLLEYIEAGMSNHEACRLLGVQSQNFYLTLSRDPEFREKYDTAKAAAVDALVDEADVAAQEARRAENGHQVAGAKVFADFKKWQAARLAPNRWGERATVHVTGAIVTDDQEMAKRVAFLEALGGSQGDEDETGPEVAPEA